MPWFTGWVFPDIAPKFVQWLETIEHSGDATPRFRIEAGLAVW
jgi:hypothetical protein